MSELNSPSDVYNLTRYIDPVPSEQVVSADPFSREAMLANINDDSALDVTPKDKKDVILVEFLNNQPLFSITVIKRICDSCGEDFPLPVQVTVLDNDPDNEEQLTIDSIPAVICGDCEGRIK